jgi:membrane protein required for beta-lactamase induction
MANRNSELFEAPELPVGVAIVEAVADWLRVHLWPCAYAFVGGAFFTAGAAWVWSFYL